LCPLLRQDSTQYTYIKGNLLMSQTCNRCKVEKPLNDFYKNKARKNGFNLACKICQIELNKKNRREKTTEWKRLNKHRKFIARVKTILGCGTCGYRAHACAIDLIPHDPSSVSKAVKSSVLSAGWSLKRIKEVIRGCFLLCSNCHRVRTHGQHVGKTEKGKCTKG